MNHLSFTELPLSKEMQKAITEKGFEEATPIQSQSIPPILEGKDVVGQAQTGTGKTCAFGIPAIEMLEPGTDAIQVLVLCPTRELAIQTAEELSSVAKYKRGVKILPIYGGQPIERQLAALKMRPQIIIGTPGRVMDHMRRNTLKLWKLKMLILDEADEMLNMGFREDIDTILSQVPEERQTILFSATMPREILDLASKYQREPVHIRAVHKELTVPKIEQYYLEVRESAKSDVLSRLIDANAIGLSLVFCNTKRRVDDVTAHLQSRGYLAEALHGDMSQAQRDKVMTKFRRRGIEILIATDVAARGLDVDNVEAVFNYDIPKDDEYYVHRIGRTGRAGKTGVAYSFVTPRELYKLREIQRYTRSTIHYLKPPTLMDVEERKINQITEAIRQTMEQGGLSKFAAYIEKMLEDQGNGNDDTEASDLTTLDVAAALLKMALGPNKAGQESLPEREEGFRGGSRNDRGMVRFFINAGSMDRIEPRHIIESISENTQLPKDLIGAINIFDKFTFVEVPREYGEEVLYALKDQRLNGRRINIEHAQKRGGSGARLRPKRDL